ncbi:MAG: pilus assembly protein PilP [Alcanivoracaceae bacterium]|nr:pilus assembly protein PilP [Alcanivoracaceae bacterium]
MKIIKSLVLAILMLTLISCKKDMSDLDVYFKDAKLTPAKQIEPLPEINSPEIFLYDSDDLRDPFSNDLQLLNEQNIESNTVVEGDGQT